MSEVKSACVFARVVLQQCLSARLQVKPALDDEAAEYVQIGRGMVIHTCFFRGATKETAEKLANKVLNVRLSEDEATGKRVSILDLPGNILIVPQATLGGRLKGNVMQYHNNLPKETSLELYTNFVELCKESVERNNVKNGSQNHVKWGTHGNRQVLAMETNGPFSHVIDL